MTGWFAAFTKHLRREREARNSHTPIHGHTHTDLDTLGVLCFYSIIKSIDLIGTSLKILPFSTYVQAETGTLLHYPSPCSMFEVHYCCTMTQAAAGS